jgi:hypothetical protein
MAVRGQPTETVCRAYQTQGATCMARASAIPSSMAMTARLRRHSRACAIVAAMAVQGHLTLTVFNACQMLPVTPRGPASATSFGVGQTARMPSTPDLPATGGVLGVQGRPTSNVYCAFRTPTVICPGAASACLTGLEMTVVSTSAHATRPVMGAWVRLRGIAPLVLLMPYGTTMAPVSALKTGSATTVGSMSAPATPTAIARQDASAQALTNAIAARLTP